MQAWMPLVRLSGLIVAVAAGLAGGVVQYRLTDLTVQSGMDYAFGINNGGQVVGRRPTGELDTYGNPVYHAVVWSNGSATDLHPFDVGTSCALGINDAGEVVGQVFIDGLHGQGFLSAGGTMRIFETDTGAKGINGAGLVVGGGSVAGGGMRPLAWQNGQARDLSIPGGRSAGAIDVNAAGQIVGESETASERHAILWDAGRAYDLNDMATSPDGWVLAEATGINAAGQIVGNATLPNSIGRAFLWDNGVVRDLGTLARSSGAVDINALGQVVGWSGGVNSWPTSHGFLWDNGVMYDLNDLVSLPNNQWLGSAFAINDMGQILSESFDDMGNVHAVLLTPVPEPMTFLVLAGGLAIIVARRVNFFVLDAGRL